MPMIFTLGHRVLPFWMPAESGHVRPNQRTVTFASDSLQSGRLVFG